MYDIVLDTIGIAVEALRENPTVRLWITVVFGVLFVASIALQATAALVFSAELLPGVKDVAPGIIAIAGIGLMLASLSYTPIRIQGGGVTRIELTSLQEEREKLHERLADKPKPDVLDTIQLSLNQLTEYYAINKGQARSSFGFSVFAVVIGLATIVGGIWIFYFSNTPNVQLATISSIAGVLVEFIGGAYFYLYRKSLIQLNLYFRELVNMQDTMLSVRLCEQVAPVEYQNQLREKVIVALLERSSRSNNVADTEG